MIYTPAFDGMPALARDAVYARMWEVLSGREKQPRYQGLSLADRRAIVEILRDNEARPAKPTFPAGYVLVTACMRPSLTRSSRARRGRDPLHCFRPDAVAHSWLTPLREDATRLVKAATADDFAWQRLAELTDGHGNRLSGSENLARAVDWAVRTMKADGLENVRTERVMVPHWVRGREAAEIVDPPRHAVPILGLGGTAPTPPGGLEAEVLVVTSFDDLRVKGADAKGRIVLFNVPYNGYSETVTYRTGGARTAAQYGAVAVLVRSVGPIGLRTTHTGSVSYPPGQPQIPAAAVSVEDANRIARLAARGRTVRMRLVLESRYEPDAESANVVGEIRGREKPNEIVLLGGHLDSWDVGTGASDDGVGLHRHVGGAAADEEARHPAAADGAHRALRRTRRTGFAGPPLTPRSTAQRPPITSSRWSPIRACSRRRRSGSRGVPRRAR